MTEPLVKYEVHGESIALLTFNRPEKMNALSTPLLQEFEAHLRAIKDDPKIRAIILTGEVIRIDDGLVINGGW